MHGGSKHSASLPLIHLWLLLQAQRWSEQPRMVDTPLLLVVTILSLWVPKHSASLWLIYLWLLLPAQRWSEQPRMVDTPLLLVVPIWSLGVPKHSPSLNLIYLWSLRLAPWWSAHPNRTPGNQVPRLVEKCPFLLFVTIFSLGVPSNQHLCI